MHLPKIRQNSFAAGLFTTAVIAIAVVASLNLVVDPYGAWRLVELPGLNVHKPALHRRVKLAKAYDLRRIKPEAIVLGTSRSHIALRPSHEGWGVAPGHRYNAAFDGATTQEMFAYLRHAQVTHPLRQVVLGLDTWQLSHNSASVRPDFDASLLYTSHSLAQRLAIFAADVRIVLSVDTLRASVATLMSQTSDASDWLAPDGQRLDDVFFHTAEEEYRSLGTGDYLRGIDRQEAGFKLPAVRTEQRRPVAVSSETLTSFDYIGRIVAFCREQGIDLRIFLTPAHAHQLELAAEVGEWPAIEQGKRELVALLARDAASHPSTAPFTLIDFSGYSLVTTDPVPLAGSHVEMSYYWDSSHFKEVVGDWILDRLFGYARPDRPPPPGFGVALTSESIESAVTEMRRARGVYDRDNPGEAQFIAALVAQVRTEKAATPHQTRSSGP